jgi:hypothetical protein
MVTPPPVRRETAQVPVDVVVHVVVDPGLDVVVGTVVDDVVVVVVVVVGSNTWRSTVKSPPTPASDT